LQDSKEKEMKFYATTLVNKHVNAKTNVKCKKTVEWVYAQRTSKEVVKKVYQKFG
jgi:hypothetical protein